MAQETFSIAIDNWVKATGAKVENVVRKIGYEVFRTVVLRSPVDTGRFRSNWNYSLDSPDYSISPVDPSLKPRKPGDPVPTSAPTTIGGDRGTQQAAMVLTMKAGTVSFLSNGLPYAQRLENGYSKQAPLGMVRLTAAEFSQHVRDGVAAAAANL